MREFSSQGLRGRFRLDESKIASGSHEKFPNHQILNPRSLLGNLKMHNASEVSTRIVSLQSQDFRFRHDNYRNYLKSRVHNVTLEYMNPSIKYAILQTDCIFHFACSCFRLNLLRFRSKLSDSDENFPHPTTSIETPKTSVSKEKSAAVGHLRRSDCSDEIRLKD